LDRGPQGQLAMRLLPILDGLILVRAVGLGEVRAAAFTKG
jgi:hypothetical protein